MGVIWIKMQCNSKNFGFGVFFLNIPRQRSVYPKPIFNKNKGKVRPVK